MSLCGVILAVAITTPNISSGTLNASFRLEDGKLRETSLLPGGAPPEPPASKHSNSSGVDVELQVTGENWNEHHAKKLIGGGPGTSLRYVGETVIPHAGCAEHVLTQADPGTGLAVESHYLVFPGLQVMRRWSVVHNGGSQPAGVEHLSSAMLYGFGPLDEQLRIYVPSSSWQVEGQWRVGPPSAFGWVDNGSYNLNALSAGNVGSWSSMNYLPMGLVENRAAGLTWFWQIEHDGSWHWEISDTPDRAAYLYVGGPDALFSDAWTNIKPSQDYVSVPAAVGCVKGGLDEAVDALTEYRRRACLAPTVDNRDCPIIFNDYMNCLWGNPSPEKEASLIPAAAAAGARYFVIDAGWYADAGSSWWDSVGLWEPSSNRWSPGGLPATMERIRGAGMIPGLWLEIEVVGIRSPLAQRPDSWFMMRHGRRVIDHGRYLLDFRNREVRSFADGVIDRLVRDENVGYFKIDYNEDALTGTDSNADSAGQGLLEHQRAFLQWVDGVHHRYPDLVLENCGSGGGRMDYAMLSHFQVQSSSDQTDYRRYPSIVAGALVQVLPEQLGVWCYPRAQDNADATSFNVVNALLCRIHLSGQLASLSDTSRKELIDGLALYNARLRHDIPHMAAFFPLGLPSMADRVSAVSVGIKDGHHGYVAVWRLEGGGSVEVPLPPHKAASMLYPADLGIACEPTSAGVQVSFPRKEMAALLSFE